MPCGREPGLLLGAAGGAGDLPALGLQPARERQRGVAEPEHEQPAHRSASPHSAATAGIALGRPMARGEAGEGRRGRAAAPAPRPPSPGPAARDRSRRSAATAASARIAAVADRDQDVAQEAVAADALDRRAGEARAKARVVEPRELGQRRRAQIVPRGELRLGRAARELVPRADREAVVAAEDAIADRPAELARDVARVLDREVGDAAPGVELVGRREGVGRADVEAGPAGAAMVALGRIGGERAGRSGSRRGTARSRARARRGWCACPASRSRPPGRAASRARARCRRRP